MNKLLWNFNRNSNIFIQENAFESVVCEMAAILSPPQWVNNKGALWHLLGSNFRSAYEQNWQCVHRLWVTHIPVSKLTITDSVNGLLPGQCQAIIWTNAGLLLIGPLGTNFSEIVIQIHTFSLKKMHLKLSSGKWRPFCLALDVLKN